MKSHNALFANIPTTIFTVMSSLAVKHDAVNLGQGFPDTDGPSWIRDYAARAIIDGPNQYAPMMGVPALRNAVAEANKRFYGLDIDPDSEVMVTSGATEALMDSCLALLNPGDEAIVIEPFYDSYVPQIKAAGATPKFVRLQAPDWTLDTDDLKSAFSSKTKLIILNTPMNPCSKIFTLEELQVIADLLIEYDAYAICDEVYEHLCFDHLAHIPLMTLPQMKERCIRIGSAGKTFSLTGWKIGYITACSALLKTISAVHQFVNFATPAPLQIAVAAGIVAGDDYYASLTQDMDHGRRILTEGLSRIGFDVLPCEGTYFLSVDFYDVAKDKGFTGSDLDFCKWITSEAGVAAIPMSAFFAPENGEPPQSLIRFCFAKKEAVLNEALRRLSEFFE